MQIQNDYDKQVFNGDMGTLVRLDLEDQLAVVEFDGVAVGYEFVQLDELVHAYAVSITNRRDRSSRQWSFLS
jgi:exodeoxyribonuclease V alpha subunit